MYLRLVGLNYVVLYRLYCHLVHVVISVFIENGATASRNQNKFNAVAHYAVRSVDFFSNLIKHETINTELVIQT